MKSASIILFILVFSMSLFSNSLAQDWEPPFEFKSDFLSFPFPSDNNFNEYDSGLVILKVQFHEKENRINWFDLLRVDLFKNDSVAYNFFNTEINPDWSTNAKRTNIEVYPDSITVSLVRYLEKIKAIEYEPTKYAEDYRLIPIFVPVRLYHQKNPAY